MKISFQDNADQGNEEWVTVLNGKIQIPVEEKPILLLGKEKPAGK